MLLLLVVVLILLDIVIVLLVVLVILIVLLVLAVLVVIVMVLLMLVIIVLAAFILVVAIDYSYCLCKQKRLMNLIYRLVHNSLFSASQSALFCFLPCLVARFFSLMYAIVFLFSVNIYSTNTLSPYPSSWRRARFI